MSLNEIYKIGNRIKKIRTEKGLTQKEMAELAKIPYSTYSNYENNNRVPRMGQIRNIASVLGVTIHDLLGIAPDDSLNMNINFPNLLIEEKDDKIVIGFDQYSRTGQSDLEDKENILLQNFRKLNAKGKEKVMDITEDFTYIEKYTKFEE